MPPESFSSPLLSLYCHLASRVLSVKCVNARELRSMHRSWDLETTSMPRTSQIAETTGNLNGASNFVSKVPDSTSAHASVESSPRSTLAWKDDWGNENAAPEISNSASGCPLEPRTPPRERPHRSLPTPTGTISRTADRWRSPPLSPIRALEHDVDEESRGPQVSDRWEAAWLSRSPRAPSRTSSYIRYPRSYEDEIRERAEDLWTVKSSSAAILRDKTLPQDRSDSINALNHELLSIKSCAKRAVDLGKKVQDFADAEILQLQTEKAHAEGKARMFLDTIQELEQQLYALREDNGKLEVERQAIQGENQELESQRDSLLVAVRDERKERETAQREKDYILATILEERMKAEGQRETLKNAIRGQKKKLEDMEKGRDAAIKTLQDEKHKMDVERDAMLMAMRELKTRLEFDRETNLRSMRRSSLDICIAKMISGERRQNSRVIEKQFSWNH